MGNRDDFAARLPVAALLIEASPQVDRVDSAFHYADRKIGHVFVAEDDVAMEMTARVDSAGPFIGHEARELAGGASVVGFFGGCLVLFPDDARGVVAELCVFSAETPSRTEHRIASIEHEERYAGEAAIHATGKRAVAFRVWRVADMHFADLLGVIGDGGEVEGAGELDAPHGTTVFGVGLNAEGFAAGEEVGLSRRYPSALGRGVL